MLNQLSPSYETLHKCGSTYRSSHQKCFFKKCVLRNSVKLRPQACSLIKIETLAHVFFCEFWEISKNTFLIEHLWASASVHKIFQNTQNSNRSYVTFLWRHYISRRSLKLSIFMNKSNFPYKWNNFIIPVPTGNVLLEKPI